MAKPVGDDENARLRAEIAALSGAIKQHGNSGAPASSSYHHHHQNPSHYVSHPPAARASRASYRGAYRGTLAPRRGGAAGGANHLGSGSRNRTLILHSAATTTSAPGPSDSTPKPPSGSDRLVQQGGKADTPVVGASNAAAAAAAPAAAADAPEQWVKRKSTHNVSLVRGDAFARTEAARLASLQATADKKSALTTPSASSRPLHALRGNKTSAAASSAASASASSGSVRRGPNMGEVIIDGVTFVFDKDGTKLIKKPPPPTTTTPSSTSQATNTTGNTSGTDGHVAQAASRHVEGEATAASTVTTSSGGASPSTPLRTSVNGQRFVRTKNGNLISVQALEGREAERKRRRLETLAKGIADRQRARYAASASGKKRGSGGGVGRAASKSAPSSRPRRRVAELCSYFTRSGQCKRGLSCPFVHDASKLALCPGSLRASGCSFGDECRLSHERAPQRTPHCVGWLRSGCRTCRRRGGGGGGEGGGADRCPYAHPKASPPPLPPLTLETPICRSFSELGWCESGDACAERHTWECKEFVERGGVCERKGCRALHVVRARPPAAAASAAAGAGRGAEGGAERADGDEDEDEEQLLFVRDDAAARDETSGGSDTAGASSPSSSSSGEEEDEDGRPRDGEGRGVRRTEGASGRRARKRPRYADAALPDEAERVGTPGGDDAAVASSAMGPTTTAGAAAARGRAKRARAFERQADFIGLGEVEGEDEDDEDGEEGEDGLHEVGEHGGDDDDDEHGSVESGSDEEDDEDVEVRGADEGSEESEESEGDEAFVGASESGAA